MASLITQPSVPGRRREKAVSLRDVAEAAGVSATTVSRVLSHSAIPSPETRRRVLEAVTALNYQPDPAFGQAVRRRRLNQGDRRVQTRTIGFLISEASLGMIQAGHTFYNAVLVGIQKLLADHKYHLMLAAQPTGSEAIPLFVSEQRLDGLLIGCDLPAMTLQYIAGQMPVVFLGRRAPEGIPADSAMSDGYQAMTRQLAYLYQLGHRRIVRFEQALANDTQQQRLRAYADFARDHALEEGLAHPLNQLQPISMATHAQVIEHYVQQWLACGAERPTALVAQDNYALDLMQAFQRQGVAIPQALSISGVHEHGRGALVSPALTSYDIPMDQVGEAGARMLLERLEGPEGAAAAPRHLTIAGRSQIRASCAPPAPGSSPVIRS